MDMLEFEGRRYLDRIRANSAGCGARRHQQTSASPLKATTFSIFRKFAGHCRICGNLRPR